MTAPHYVTLQDAVSTFGAEQLVNPVCFHCGSRHVPNGESVHGVILCRSCQFTCDECEETFVNARREAYVPWRLPADSPLTRERWINVNSTGGRYRTCCAPCAENVSARCERCLDSFEVHSLDDDNHCHHCAEIIADEEQEAEQRARERAIGGYHNAERKRATRLVHSAWTKRHNRFIGVESEAECNGRIERCDAAHAVLNAAHGRLDWKHEPMTSRLLFCEHDGSLDDGFEMITQPMGLDTHRELWARVCNTHAVRSLRAHDTTTCGLHVHVSRAGLSALTIAKVVCFLNSDFNDRFITLIARRIGNGYCKKKAAEKVRANLRNSWDRYERLNLTNPHTVEFRIFRGTTNYKTLIGSVEFCHNVIEFCAQAGLESLTLEAFIAWLYRPEQKADSVELRALIARRLDGPTRLRISHLIPTHKPRPTTTTTGA